ncbi:hypothetical protein EZV62_020889 [Acer yangbiense]|uniref:Retroviral polymerase SH3-like domain-containing protein n=1 Tax=Acer yangbiense TaxID=1000413 RepID=A0A5C7HES4_9ROSI|nr:hypothetical protein EZV62_020889 [Acer yangbiense]
MDKCPALEKVNIHLSPSTADDTMQEFETDNSLKQEYVQRMILMGKEETGEEQLLFAWPMVHDFEVHLLAYIIPETTSKKCSILSSFKFCKLVCLGIFLSPMFSTIASPSSIWSNSGFVVAMQALMIRVLYYAISHGVENLESDVQNDNLSTTEGFCDSCFVGINALIEKSESSSVLKSCCVGQLVENGYRLHFEDGGCTIFDKKEKDLVIAYVQMKRNRNFSIDLHCGAIMALKSEVVQDTWLWHKSSNTKGYRLYDVETGKLIVSRDVIFDENAAWDWKEKKELEQPPVILQSQDAPLYSASSSSLASSSTSSDSSSPVTPQTRMQIPGADVNITIECDSQAAVSCVNGAGDVGNLMIRECILDIKEILLSCKPRLSVKVTSRGSNAAADFLTNQGVQSGLVQEAWV